MVQQYPMQQYFRQTPLTVDTAHAQQKFFAEEPDDGSILDDGVLDHSAIDSGLEMSPPMVDSRRESFAVGGSLFSPKQEEWQSVEMQSVSSNAGNPFMDQPHSSNPFMQHAHHQQPGPPQPQPFASQPGQWSMSNSGSATPLQQFDGLPAEFDTNASIFHRQSISSHTPFGMPASNGLFSSLNGQSTPSPPKEPWMGGPSHAAMSKKMRPNSPTTRSHNELRRGDGIRKKNARFEIPAERNLSNIDQLIAQSTDDQEIKELKQQKRLLRNRQAALDSRQRKKQHTERLEDEKKQFSGIMNEMEEDLERLRQQVQDMMAEKDQCTQYIEKLSFDKEEMIRMHTNETGDLRKKISVLTSHVQSLESAAAASMPSHGFPGSAPFSEMEGLTMDGPWDSMGGFMSDFSMEQQQQQQHPVPEVKQEPPMQIVPVVKKSAADSDAEKPASQGGLLFMLFLVGAFVMSSRQPPAMPHVSEDIRAASATLLENVLKDAGVPSVEAALTTAPGPGPSASSFVQPMTGLDGVAPSMLGDLSDALTQPTQEQANEQLFGLSAAQYSGVVGGAPGYSSTGLPARTATTSAGRRNLAEALAAMRGSSKADVYTRSLLWDQIPGDVVRTFARMMTEANSPTGGDGVADG